MFGLRCSFDCWMNSVQIKNSHIITICSSLYKFVKPQLNSPKIRVLICSSHHVFLLDSVADVENKPEGFPPIILISVFPMTKVCGGGSLLKVEELDLRN